MIVASLAAHRERRNATNLHVTVGVVAAHITWMRERNYASSTIDARRRALRAIEETADVLTADARTVGNVLAARNLSPATRNLWISHLSAFYRWAADEGLCTSNPAARAGRARHVPNLPRPIGERDLATAFAGASPKIAAWLALGAYAGLRCAEIAKLHPEHVSETALRIERSKGGKSRVVPMHPVVRDRIDALEQWWTHPPRVVSIYLNRHLRACGLSDTAHSLRHRFATQVYDRTGDIHLVADLLGHSSIETTRIYAAVSPTRRAAAVALIA